MKLTETKEGRIYRYRGVKGKLETNHFSVICLSSHPKRVDLSLHYFQATSAAPVGEMESYPELGMEELGGDS